MPKEFYLITKYDYFNVSDSLNNSALFINEFWLFWLCFITVDYININHWDMAMVEILHFLMFFITFHHAGLIDNALNETKWFIIIEVISLSWESI